MSRRLHSVSWIVGLAVLGGIIWYFRPADFLPALQRVGFSGVVGWLIATSVARLLDADLTARLLEEMGSVVGRMKLFCVGWLRTFAIQVVPMNGHDLVVALKQQRFIHAIALGAAGSAAVAANSQLSLTAVAMLLAVFVVMAVVGLASSGLRALSVDLAGILVGSLVMRAARAWLLFAALGITLDWHQALLIVVLAGLSRLVTITPGGLGIREALFIGGAILIGLPANTAVIVALIDRLLVVTTAGIASLPSTAYLLRR